MPTIRITPGLLMMWGALLALIVVLAWSRLFTSDTPIVYSDTLIAHEVTPMASMETLKQCALSEVKRREGWSGIAEPAGYEGRTYYIIVRRKPGPTNDWRYLSLDYTTGALHTYEVRTDQLDLQSDHLD